MNLDTVARVVLGIGFFLLVTGGILLLLSRLGVTRLPGDIVWRGERTTVYVPLGLSILASIILTVLLSLFLRR
jgi:hypothetical protein